MNYENLYQKNILTDDDVIKQASDLCKEKGHWLLYLTKSGSHLYGTSTPESDRDYKGVFLPSRESLLLQNKCNSITYSTSDDENKNSESDIDVELYSLQYFLQLVGKGETNGLDLLYSQTNRDAVLYHHIKLDINEPMRLFNPMDANAYIGFAIGQSQKYGLKGTRLSVIKNIFMWLIDNNFMTEIRTPHGENDLNLVKVKDNISDDVLKRIYDINFYTTFQDLKNHLLTRGKRISQKLETIANKIVKEYGHKSFCFIDNKQEQPALVVCGKNHQLDITIGEFYNRIKREYNRYGKRSEKAMESGGVDWKSLSHAVRVLYQMKELILTGWITFPLQQANYIMDVKMGERPFDEVEKHIMKEIDEIDKIRKTCPEKCVKGKRDKDFVRQLILNFYN